MYINDINILYFVLFGFIGILVGQFVDWCNIRLMKYETVFSKEFFTKYIKETHPKYLLMIIVAAIYCILLYIYGLESIDFYKYIILTPMLISAFIIDYKEQIIPNRLTLTIFETGLLLTVIQVIVNVNLGISIAMEMLLGMITGAGIFLTITLIGIICVSLISFLLGAVISIFLLLFKRKDKSEYIAFGPFIVMASFILMAFEINTIIYWLYKIFTLGVA